LASSLSGSSSGRSISSALNSADAQSIGLPSRMAPARSVSSPSGTATFYFLRQPHQRALSRLARRIWCRFAQRLGQLFVGVAHLDPRNDGFALLRLQPRECLLIALYGLTTNGMFERRFGAVELDVVKIGGVGLPALSP